MSKTPEQVSTQRKDQQNLLILLQEAQNRLGYLSQETMSTLANSLGISISQVYGAATFYSFLSTTPQGRNVIRICKSLPCFINNSDVIIECVEREIGIKPGGSTADGKFTFELTNCIGACDIAPAMMINDKVYGELTGRKISRILKACE